jgi:tagatose-6-phosphate ketose/aldose isomerase
VLQKAIAMHPDSQHLVVSCNASGRIIRESPGKPQVFAVCLDDAVNDRGLAMTSSFSNMLVFGQCLAHAEDPTVYERVLMALVEAGRSLYSKQPIVRQVSQATLQ